MKQVLANLRTGAIEVREVPAPAPRPGFVRVRNICSLISTGTEGATVKLGKLGALGKAKARPEQALKLIELARAQGPLTAWRVAQRALDMPIALGYSCAGVVEALGEGCEGLRIGQGVACAGQGWASHAEFVSIPRRLCIPIPEGVLPEHAAFGTVGAIALHSLRVANAQLGETVVVIGLGLVGLLTCQLARASGCTVIGLDIDPRQIDLLREHGWGHGGLADDSAAGFVEGLTRGAGADAVIITAATEGPGPVELAGTLCRRKGRVVVVGRTPMHAPRETFLFKELSLLTSMAYGPGTGDPQYEVEGRDYPLAYVRFTEERNIEAFLRQIADQRIDMAPLISHRFPVAAAAEAFAAIDGGSGPRGIGVLLDYPGEAAATTTTRVDAGPAQPAPATTPGAGAKLRLGVIGAGSFATHELLPLLAGLPIERVAVASQTGIRAEALARSHSFQRCTSDADDILLDPGIDAVLILTRHDRHAELAARALAAGKHVFVEKPLALTREEFEVVERAQQASGKLLMVGFNRRYAPLAQQLKARLQNRSQPILVRYLANVGWRPADHWLHHPKEGGGVILGEGCHHLDFCAWLVGHAVTSVDVATLGRGDGSTRPLDSAQATLRFADGSVASVSYASNGNKRFPTETVEVLSAGWQAMLHDFRVLETPGRWFRRRQRSWLTTDRGHAEQLRQFVESALGTRLPFDVRSYLDSSALAIEVSQRAYASERADGKPGPA